MIRQQLTSVILKEEKALRALTHRLDEGCEKAVELLLACSGKVVLMGIGKSGHIARKLAATFASTGTPAFFVHCAECFHGDFGMIESKDVVILISNSGTTAEVVGCIPTLKKIGCKIIAITSGEDSPLARQANCVCLLPKEEEADHLGLAPTTSSTATLVLGDALACAVSQLKGFTKEEFHKFHPGGALGVKLTEEGEKK